MIMFFFNDMIMWTWWSVPLYPPTPSVGYYGSFPTQMIETSPKNKIKKLESKCMERNKFILKRSVSNEMASFNPSFLAPVDSENQIFAAVEQLYFFLLLVLNSAVYQQS